MHDLAELLVHFVQHALRALPVFASLRLALPNKRGRKILQFDAGEDFLDVADVETFALLGVGRKLWVAFTQRMEVPGVFGDGLVGGVVAVLVVCDVLLQGGIGLGFAAVYGALGRADVTALLVLLAGV